MRSRSSISRATPKTSLSSTCERSGLVGRVKGIDLGISHDRCEAIDLSGPVPKLDLVLAQVLSLLLNGIVILLVARVVPGVRVNNYGSAVLVAGVYGVLTWALYGIALFFTFPLVLVTLGLFLLVLNGFFLWVTDKLIGSFEIRGFGPLAMATVGVTVGGMLVNRIVYMLV